MLYEAETLHLSNFLHEKFIYDDDFDIFQYFDHHCDVTVTPGVKYAPFQ